MKKELLAAWRFFLSLEDDLNESFTYVEPLISSNKDTVSLHFQKIINSSCIEIENLLGLISEEHYGLKPSNIKKGRKDWNINLFKKVLDIKSITITEEIAVNKILEEVISKPFNPYDNWSESHAPDWWIINNKIKHSKRINYQSANLFNCIFSLGGLLSIFKVVCDITGELDTETLEMGTNLLYMNNISSRFNVSYYLTGESVIDGGDF